MRRTSAFIFELWNTVEMRKSVEGRKQLGYMSNMNQRKATVVRILVDQQCAAIILTLNFLARENPKIYNSVMPTTRWPLVRYLTPGILV